MFFRFFIPRLVKQPYVTRLEQKLMELDTRNWDPIQYNKLLVLKDLAARADASFSQLGCLYYDNNPEIRLDCIKLEDNIAQLIEHIAKHSDISTYKNSITNTFSNLKNKLDGTKMTTGMSVLNIANNAFWTFICIGCFCAAGAMMTGPIGMLFLGIGLTILTAGVLLLAAYSLYVDGRFLANKQVEEIGDLVEGLFSYNAEQMNPLPNRGVFADQPVLVPIYNALNG